MATKRRTSSTKKITEDCIYPDYVEINPEANKPNKRKNNQVGVEISPNYVVNYAQKMHEESKQRFIIHVPLGIMILLGATLASSVFIPEKFNEIRDILTPIISGLVGIYATMVGFYFRVSK